MDSIFLNFSVIINHISAKEIDCLTPKFRKDRIVAEINRAD